MSRVTRDQLSFSSGELSPLLRARTDYQRFQSGLASCVGFLPLRQGGVTRAPGTVFRGYTRGNRPARLIPFEFARNDSMILELTQGFMRFWRYGQRVLAPGGAPYEIAHPYTAADLPTLQWVQSSDVIYIVGGNKPMQRLARLALDNWTIGPASVSNGPFRVQNLDENVTVRASGRTGSVTLTASGAVFNQAHVGSLFRIEGQHYTKIPFWTGNSTMPVGQLVRNDGKIYRLVHPAETGSGDYYSVGGQIFLRDAGISRDIGAQPPTHESGTQQATIAPANYWEYVGDGVGIGRITAVASDTSATLQVLKRLPENIVDDPTYRWSRGAWSDAFGYPCAIEIFDQRLVCAGTPREPRTVWFSAVGDFLEFEPGTDEDDAFAYTIAGGSSQNRIMWLKDGRDGLHIGAQGEEYSIRRVKEQAVGPLNTSFGFDSAVGSLENIRPISPNGAPMFISKDGQRLFELAYDLQSDANRAIELSLPSQHLVAVGVREIAWQSSPVSIAWLRRTDGDLLAMVYDPSEDILGWSRYPLAGGRAGSLAVTASADTAADVLTMVVQRTVDGATVHMIEEQSQNWGVVWADRDIKRANHLFAAAEQVSDDPLATWTVPHLAGLTVHAWTEIGSFGPLTVPADGVVTLPVAVRSLVIGLLDPQAVIETLPFQPMANDGSARTRRKRLGPNTGITLHKTAAMTAAAVEYDMPQPIREWPAADIIPQQVLADVTSAYSGSIRAPVVSGFAQDVALRLRPVGAAPATLLAITPHLIEAGI